jgi:hypothetical protein
MIFFEINPEVIVGLGDYTTFKKNNPHEVEVLHIELEDWLGDDIMEIFPCFVITENLEMTLLKTKFTGYYTCFLSITLNEYFENNHASGKTLPTFKWLKVTGTPYFDDFGIDNKTKKMVISESVFDLLKQAFSINYLTVGNDDADAFMAEFLKDDSMAKDGGRIIGKNALDNLRGQTIKINTEVEH